MHPYDNQIFFIVTKHGKEVAFNSSLPFQNSKILNFHSNTDLYGTFSPEKPRHLTLKETLKAKANLLPAGKGRLAITSEGTFGPHPDFPFFNVDHEILLFQDRELNIELYIEEISPETNLGEKVLTPQENPDIFLNSVRFPTHGVIVFNRSLNILKKGINNYSSLKKAIEQCWQTGEDAIIQTDMRAHVNPTRMKIIEKAARKLFSRLASVCPSCKTPGFGPVDYILGAECEICGNETKLVKEIIFGCLKCDHQELRSREDKMKFASPEFCDYCNP